MGAPARQLDPLPGPLRSPRPAGPRVLPRRRPAHPARPVRHRPARRGHRPVFRRTVNAVGHLPETGVVRGLAKRPPLWICAIGSLVIAIIFINVAGLSYASRAGTLEASIQKLERRNSILRSSQTEVLSVPRIRSQASAAGMAMPPAESIRYLRFERGDVATAAAVLAAEGG